MVKGITRKLQRTPKDQYTLTIPKTLVQILGWSDKDEIEFGFEKGKITLKRTKKAADKKGKSEKKKGGPEEI